ncbi:hypothetical protein HYDPIDRAFT_22956 [Hydnomerulius pinastri MD-312]|nr:hypothetical protein HYDPIDRAFT_22956 [Hydnomerulius pinastri MD-312]
MSLVKLPLVISSTLAVHVACTPPHQPSRGEIIKPTMYERFMIYVAKNSMRSITGVYWLGAVAEIAAILAKNIDPTLVPQALQAAVSTLRTLHETPVTPAFLFGGILTTLGGLLRWKCYRTLGRYFTFMLSVRKEHKLVTSGPYAWVRHPAYTGLMMCLVGLSVMHGSRDSFLRASGISRVPGVQPLAVAWIAGLAFANVGLLKRMRAEDEVMKAAFGQEWDRWASKVKYMLIPGIY